MKVEFQEKRLITSQNVEAKPGHFALDATPLTWENCRERFAKMFKEDTVGFYFKHEANQSLNVASFVLKTECILKVEEKSKFAETNRASILWFEPSAFWKQCQMRRSLLTILLRCGILYNAEVDNYEDALFRQDYVIPTKRAVMRFLFGFTKYVGPDISTDATVQFKGWKTIFEGKSPAEIKQMLVWPDGNPYTPSVEMTETLWI